MDNESRSGARFCSRCGALLQEATPAWSPPQPPPQPPPSTAQPAATSPSWQQPLPAAAWPAAYPPESPQPPQPATSQTAIKAGPLGGHSLLTIGGLIALFAFMLPWASCSSGLGMDLELSGLDMATQSSQYGGDASWAILLLVPLGALALLTLGILGLAADLGGKSFPVNLTRWVSRLPLVAILAVLCSCCPSCAFFLSIQNTRSDPSGLGALVQTEYGFWLTLFGLLLAFIGMAALLVIDPPARQKSAPP